MQEYHFDFAQHSTTTKNGPLKKPERERRFRFQRNMKANISTKSSKSQRMGKDNNNVPHQNQNHNFDLRSRRLNSQVPSPAGVVSPRKFQELGSQLAKLGSGSSLFRKSQNFKLENK